KFDSKRFARLDCSRKPNSNPRTLLVTKPFERQRIPLCIANGSDFPTGRRAESQFKELFNFRSQRKDTEQLLAPFVQLKHKVRDNFKLLWSSFKLAAQFITWGRRVVRE